MQPKSFRRSQPPLCAHQDVRRDRRVVTGDPAAILPPQFFRSGEVAEWLKAHAWKACIRETVSWVRIPPSPPVKLKLFGIFSIISILPITQNPYSHRRSPPWSIEDIGAAFVVKDAR